MTSINESFSNSLYGDDVKSPEVFEGGRSETDDKNSAYNYYTRHAPRRPGANSMMPIQRIQQTQGTQQSSQSAKEQPSVFSRKGENVQAYTGQVYGSSAFSNKSLESNVSESVYERQMSNHNKSHFQKPPAMFAQNASEFSQPALGKTHSALANNHVNCSCCKCNGSNCMVQDPLTEEVSCLECNSNALRL